MNRNSEISPLSELSWNCNHLWSEWQVFWFGSEASNRFWVIRALLGFATFGVLIEKLASVNDWLGTQGWISPAASLYLIGKDVPGTGADYRWSLFYEHPDWVVPACWLGIGASILMIVGKFGRIGAVLAWGILAMLHHRAPLLTGRGEPLLAASLLYTLLVPSDPRCSLWGCLLQFRSASTPEPQDDTSVQRVVTKHDARRWRWVAGVGVRLLQVHFAIWILFSFFSMLAVEGWWTGESVRQLFVDGQGWMPRSWASVRMAEYLAHGTLAAHGLLLAAIFFPALRFLGQLALAVLILAILLIVGDWSYALVLYAASTSLWSLPIPIPTFLRQTSQRSS